VFGGLTEQETANALELPLRSVQRLWQRARERLRTLLPG
jgi:DNA-directed RNA polymerase specialized sigma24 family protein